MDTTTIERALCEYGSARARTYDEPLNASLYRAAAEHARRASALLAARAADDDAIADTLAAKDPGAKEEPVIVVAELVPNPAPPTYKEAHWGEESTWSGELDVGDPRRNRSIRGYGTLLSVVYLTRKGGDADLTEYEHKFASKRPVLGYGSRDGRLYVAGGSYRCDARGIVG